MIVVKRVPSATVEAPILGSLLDRETSVQLIVDQSGGRLLEFKLVKLRLEVEHHGSSAILERRCWGIVLRTHPKDHRRLSGKACAKRTDDLNNHPAGDALLISWRNG